VRRQVRSRFREGEWAGMLSIGFLELAIVTLISLVGLAIPIVTLIIAILIYRKVNRIEEVLQRRE
jgi:hypothetical protein